MKMEKEIRNSSSFEIMERNGDEPTVIQGYAAVFDSPGQVYEPRYGCFTEYLRKGSITDELVAKSDVFYLLDHDRNKVIARSNKGKGNLTLSVDEKGLRFSFKIPNTQLGNDLKEYIRTGMIDSCSFAFTLKDDEDCEYERKEGKLIRYINKIRGLYDVSAVFTPAYQATSISARSQDYIDKQIEIEKQLDELDKIISNL